MIIKKKINKTILLFVLIIASFFCLKKSFDEPPVQITDKIVVINQGHSKYAAYRDLGSEGYVVEADINEQIAVKLASQLKNCGYRVYLTHPAPGFDGPTLVTADEARELKDKVNPAINALNPDLVISIHCNATVSGVQSGYLLYWSSYKENLDQSPDIYEKEGVWNNGDTAYIDPTPCTPALKSLEFAELLYDAWGKDFGTDRCAQPDHLYHEIGLGKVLIPRFKCIRERDDSLPSQTNVPCVLIEAGFITNASDAVFLRDPLNQARLAGGIISAINRFFHVK